MGVLPLQFPEGERRESLGLTGEEEFSITGLGDGVGAKEVTVRADDKEFTGPRAHRHAQGGRVLPARRHPAVRAAPADEPRRRVSVPDVLRRLLTAAGPSGYEQAPAAVFREACSAFTSEVGSDTVGSTVARVRGSGDGPLVAIAGHIDEIGLIVPTSTTRASCGSPPSAAGTRSILVGQRVDVVTRDGAVPGVVGKKPIHLLRDEERKKVAGAPRPAHRHRREGRRRGARARAHRRRRGDRRRAGRAAERAASSRARWTTASAPTSRSRRRGWSPRPAAPPAMSRRWRSTQEEITFAGSRTTAFSLRARRRDRGRRDVRDRRAGRSTRRS